MHNDYTGQRGMRYIGMFKPTVPYAIGHGLMIVPAGWGFFEIPAYLGEYRANVSYVVGDESLTDEQLTTGYRDLLIFDAFVMNDNLAICFYDANLLQLEVVKFGVEEGVAGDKDDKHNQIDYSNITPHVFAGPIGVEVPPLSYEELYDRYRNLAKSDKEIIEWLAAKPRPAPRRDGFANSNYWQLLHLNVLLERIIGLPPTCPGKMGVCAVCGRQPQPHYSMSRRDWLRQSLSGRIADADLVEKYVSVVEAARYVRNKSAHGPHFDRSRMPVRQVGDSISYDTASAIAGYQNDSVALSTLIASLEILARCLVLDQILDVKYYHAPPTGWATSTVLGRAVPFKSFYKSITYNHDLPWATLEAGLAAFEPGFTLKREQPPQQIRAEIGA